MNSPAEDKKRALLKKLREEPKPVLTRVVPAVEPEKVLTKPEASKDVEMSQFNTQIPAELLKRFRMQKVASGRTLSDLTTEALEHYLRGFELLK